MGQLACEPGIFRLRHQSQRLRHTLVRKQAQKRRLLQLCRQPLPQRTVEDRIARGVGELGENDAVLLRETIALLMGTIVKPARHEQGDKYNGGGNQNLPEFPARYRNLGHLQCAR